jgi:hypothetical protein
VQPWICLAPLVASSASVPGPRPRHIPPQADLALFYLLSASQHPIPRIGSVMRGSQPPKDKSLGTRLFFAANFPSQQRQGRHSAPQTALREAHPMVRRSSPSRWNPRRHPTFGGPSKLGLCCAATHSMGDGRTVQACSLPRCVGEPLTHPLVCVSPLPVASSVRCRVGGLSLFLWPILRPIPSVQQAERTCRAKQVEGKERKGQAPGERGEGQKDRRVPFARIPGLPPRGDCGWRQDRPTPASSSQAAAANSRWVWVT